MSSKYKKYKEDDKRDKDYYDLPPSINNKGFLYEEYIFELLKEENLVPSGFTPAGSDDTAPDCKFIWKNKEYNLEIKLNENADYGQSGLKYNVSTKKWFLDGKTSIYHRTMRKNLENIGVPSFVQKAWGSFGTPRLFERASKKEKMTWDDKEYDYNTFKDQYISLDNRTFFNYYNSKKTYYIQIGGYGTYYLGADPANLREFTEIFKFDGSVKLRIRKKGSTISPNYRFSTALMIDKKPTKSSFDISKSDSIDFLIANLSK